LQTPENPDNGKIILLKDAMKEYMEHIRALESATAQMLYWAEYG